MTAILLPRSYSTPVTASGVLPAGRHTTLDASSGPLTMTLPVPGNVDAVLSVEKVDPTGNPITVGGPIRGGGATLTLTSQYETAELRWSGATWRVTSGYLESGGGSGGSTGPTLPTVTTVTGTAYTLSIGNAENIVEYTGTGTLTVTVPTDASVGFPLETSIVVRLYAAGTIVLAGATGVLLRSPSGLRLTSQYAQAVLSKRGANEWLVSGLTVV